MKSIRKNIEIGIAIGLICAIVMSFSHFDAVCDDLRSNVLRLHIIANSDSEFDQKLKLTVRDGILEATEELFENCKSLDDAILVSKNNIEYIAKVAQNILTENGVGYNATAEVGNSSFNTREYDDFTLPAGEYKSLIVKLGKAEGKNWWCVVFPAVCIPAASESALSDSTSKVSAEIAENSGRYIMKFKVIEWYERIKEKLCK